MVFGGNSSKERWGKGGCGSRAGRRQTERQSQGRDADTGGGHRGLDKALGTSRAAPLGG